MEQSRPKLQKISFTLATRHDQKSKSPFKEKQENFRLDCSNRDLSSMQPYSPEKDRYTKSYLTTLCSHMRTQKSPKQCLPPKANQKSVGAQQFKKFLQKTYSQIKKNLEGQKDEKHFQILNKRQNSYNYLNKSSISKGKFNFLQKKFNCYRVKVKKNEKQNNLEALGH